MQTAPWLSYANGRPPHREEPVPAGALAGDDYNLRCLWLLPVAGGAGKYPVGGVAGEAPTNLWGHTLRQVWRERQLPQGRAQL
jgi:hypothetical protein